MTSPAIDEGLSKAREIGDNFSDFFDTVNDVLDWVPGFLEHLIQPAIDAVNWLKGKIEEFWNTVKEFLDNTGSPSKLEAHSEALINGVFNPLNTMAGDIAPEKLATSTEWTGSGAEAYKQVVPAEVKGVEGLRDLSKDLANTLKELANGIENFWIAMGVAFASLIVGAIAAIAEACTIIGIPAAVATIAGAIGLAIGAIGTAIMELKGIYDTIDTSQDTIDQGLTELGEEWAKASPENQAKIEDPGQWEPL
jgi:uncharacterized protein YukE